VMLIAGGAAPRLSDDRSYLDYLLNLRKKAAAISEAKILFRGFVPEEEICSYFSAADLVVFPYNICVASSGPLSLAASYGKPFLVASSFREIVRFNEIVFRNDPQQLAYKINKLFVDDAFRQKVLDFSKTFKKERLWSNIGLQTYELYKGVIKRK
jgi:glycosyltransferase involved in cell wall biosynthesis